MATKYCDYCDKMIDLDWEIEHFDYDDGEKCFLQKEAEKSEKSMGYNEIFNKMIDGITNE